jgi:PAS domain S-box-containing protein
MNDRATSPPAAGTALRILMLEDDANDAELVDRALRRDGVECETLRVDAQQPFLDALENFKPDICLLDYKLPFFDGATALELLRKRHPQIPAVMVTGALGEEAAIELLKLGARDYVLKDHMIRLVPAVRRALSEAQAIRARKAAEQAMRESEERFRNLIEGATDIIAIARLDGTITYISPAVREVGGYEPQELIGRNYFELVDPDDLVRAQSNLASTLQQPGRPILFETRFRHKDGSSRDIESVARNLTQVPGVGGVVVNMRDVTERRKAAAALQESERRFSAILANVQLISLMLDRDARITYCNGYFQNLVGWPHDEIVGRNWFEHFVPPEARPAVGAVFADMLMDKPQAWHHENEVLTRAGERRRVRWSNVILRAQDGSVVGIASLGEDITEQRRSEEALRASHQIISGILDSIPVRVFWKDRSLVYLGCNAAFARDAGFSSPKDVIGKDDFQMGWREQAKLYQG